ncbi:hypothetical protein SAMN00790413_06220 [Deinococcus hopiensis KR-140]|uniref:Uncharacterized protein n=1 Tax=Deinococcus hopiensis KR-140 TaxID=695939 RepID=A0A1W1VU83_9DEIO|nr:hypothetical protein SAMN00790413_06220 [Deinococcus hopiensis KR-140]
MVPRSPRVFCCRYCSGLANACSWDLGSGMCPEPAAPQRWKRPDSSVLRPEKSKFQTRSPLPLQRPRNKPSGLGVDPRTWSEATDNGCANPPGSGAAAGNAGVPRWRTPVERATRPTELPAGLQLPERAISPHPYLTKGPSQRRDSTTPLQAHARSLPPVSSRASRCARLASWPPRVPAVRRIWRQWATLVHHLHCGPQACGRPLTRKPFERKVRVPAADGGQVPVPLPGPDAM